MSPQASRKIKVLRHPALESERGARSCLDETSPRFESTVRCAPIRDSLTHHPMPGLLRPPVMNPVLPFFFELAEISRLPSNAP